jgi:hypothetical protein
VRGENRAESAVRVQEAEQTRGGGTTAKWFSGSADRADKAGVVDHADNVGVTKECLNCKKVKVIEKTKTISSGGGDGRGIIDRNGGSDDGGAAGSGTASGGGVF